MIVGCLADFESFAAIQHAVVALPPVRAPGMTVEHAEHLVPGGNALTDFANGREGPAPSGLRRGRSVADPHGRDLLFNPSCPLPRGRLRPVGVKGRQSRAKRHP